MCRRRDCGGHGPCRTRQHAAHELAPTQRTSSAQPVRRAVLVLANRVPMEAKDALAEVMDHLPGGRGTSRTPSQAAAPTANLVDLLVERHRRAGHGGDHWAAMALLACRPPSSAPCHTPDSHPSGAGPTTHIVSTAQPTGMQVSISYLALGLTNIVLPLALGGAITTLFIQPLSKLLRIKCSCK